MLLMLSVALAVPATVGLKVMLKDVLWPAEMVVGRARPPMVNWVLFVLAAVKVTPAPLALRVPEAEPLVPATTLPKLKLDGVTMSWPAVVELVPVPDSEMLAWALDALLLMPALAVKAPAALGVKSNVSVAL